ncbi:hypothetical protein CC77DRAFT_500230 [Alternaria alternata]|uniref:Uncharacterized protein n=1 Tax=Alternaria alternata TaxID=5599 RepID=A0A177D7G6_ALTAL|nr:hypothetical protein CC77DRAFT_500230 [Alternaria alternata]OAG14859.1 hypothetical protein CC77DRAFT_500230 [Alternaria alternata]
MFLGNQDSGTNAIMSNRLVLPQVAVLKPNLQGWMIFMLINALPQFIVISSVIGAGIFNNGGSAIKVAGPAGALVALLVMLS